jgi:hypothetical protein
VRVTVHLLQGDARHLPLADASVDAIVCDPPYGLEFMGKAWDHGVPGVPFWIEALRVAKPGAHLLAFGGTRTHHRLMVALEDAGWEIRDCLMWLYGSGFPKSLDVGKAIDKRGGVTAEFKPFRDAVIEALAHKGRTRAGLQSALGNHMISHYLTAGSQPAIPNWRDYQVIREFCGLGDTWDHLFANEAEREKVGEHSAGVGTGVAGFGGMGDGGEITAPATDAARQWDGWGTALKPAWEPIILARKPLAGTVAQNVQAHGTGALNIDGGRIGIDGGTTRSHQAPYSDSGWRTGHQIEQIEGGRWPANLILDEAAAARLDGEVGEQRSAGLYPSANGAGTNIVYGKGAGDVQGELYADTGGPSRFFYTAKASRSEREAWLGRFAPKTPGELTDRKDGNAGTAHPRAGAARSLSERDNIDVWVNAVLEAVLRADMEALLQRATAGFTRADGSAWSTWLSGNSAMVQSLTATASTTSTETNSTTGSPTFERLIPSHTSAFIQDALSAMESGSSPADYVAMFSRLTENIGISSMDGRPTTAPAISETLCALSEKGGVPNRMRRRNTHPT